MWNISFLKHIIMKEILWYLHYLLTIFSEIVLVHSILFFRSLENSTIYNQLREFFLNIPNRFWHKSKYNSNMTCISFPGIREYIINKNPHLKQIKFTDIFRLISRFIWSIKGETWKTMLKFIQKSDMTYLFT